VDVAAIRSLCAYNDWVNDRLFAIAEQLPADRARERFGASFDTIHGTLAHILGAEITWLSRWQGVSPTRVLGGDDFPDLAAIWARWQEQRRDLAAFLAELTPAEVERPLRYTNTRGEAFAYPLWQMLVHVVNHGTHHRAELAEMLTRAGHPPPPTDLLVYYDELAGAV
jgi:uncharacterized damage-inducible protein DinB